jgi:hypothetical protein
MIRNFPARDRHPKFTSSLIHLEDRVTSRPVGRENSARKNGLGRDTLLFGGNTTSSANAGIRDPRSTELAEIAARGNCLRIYRPKRNKRIPDFWSARENLSACKPSTSHTYVTLETSQVTSVLDGGPRRPNSETFSRRDLHHKKERNLSLTSTVSLL